MTKRRRQSGKKGNVSHQRSDASLGKGQTQEGGEGREEGEGREKESPGGRNPLREWMTSLIVALALFIVIRSFLANTFVIISESMEETLLVGDLLLVNRAAVGSRVPGTSIRIPGYSNPDRGDVLVFDPHHEVDMKLVKRLLGLPGDTLEMKSKALFVNGSRVEEPYVRHELEGGNFADTSMSWQLNYLLPGMDLSRYRPTRDDWGPIVVPEGHYFMLGDNRDSSLDSRFWGPLAQERIEGRVMLIYFSYNRGSLRPFPWLREIRWGRVLDLVG